MALLVGDNTNHASTTGMSNGVAWFLTAGYTAVASGSATSAFIKSNDWGGSSASRIKVIVFNSGGTQLAISDPITVPNGAPGFASAAFSSPPTITSGQTYYLAAIVNSGTVDWYHSGATFQDSSCSGTYTYADPSGASISSPGAVNSGLPAIYLDGSAAGRTTKNIRSSPLGMELGMGLGMGDGA